MTNKKVPELDELTSLDDDDVLYIVDVSDTTDHASGTAFKAKAKNVRGYPEIAAESAVTIVNYQYKPGNILRYGTNTTPGTTDMTAALVSALAANTSGRVIFPAGTFYIVSDIVLPSETYILIEPNCTVNCDQRWTATAKINITIEINGSLNQTQEPTDFTQIQSWTSAGENDRGFLEFFAGGAGTTTIGGYKVFGTGSITGSYAGTIGDEVVWLTESGIGGKGIGCWSAIDTEVSGLTISGFKGEAVYARQPRKNVHFKDNFVFDTNANAFNFNSSVSFEDCSIENNITKNVGTCVEASTGIIKDNTAYDSVLDDFHTGDGGGFDDTKYINNTSIGCGKYGFRISYEAAGNGTDATTNGYLGLRVIGNTVVDCVETGYYLNNLGDFEFSGNSVDGYDTAAAGTLIGINALVTVVGHGSGNSVTQTVSGAGALINLGTPATNDFNLTNTSLNYQDGSRHNFNSYHYAAGDTGLVSDRGHRFGINNFNAAETGQSLYGSIWQGGGTTTDDSIYAGLQFAAMFESGGAGGDIVFFTKKSAGAGWTGLPAETFRITNDEKLVPYQNNRGEFGAAALALANVFSDTFSVGSGGTQAAISAGTGSPESSVTATTGSLYLNRSGGEGATVYAKESGAGNTGWRAIAGVAEAVTALDDTGTPTVLDGKLFKTGGTTAITDFDNGVVGQTIQIISAHAITITDGSIIILNGSVDFVMAAADTLTLTMFDDQVWQETARMVNL